MKFRTALAAAALLASAGAQAANTLYLNEADYLAAVGPTQAFTDFAGSPATVVPGNAFLPEVLFIACGDGCAPAVFHVADAITDIGSTIVSNNVGSLGGIFAAPTRAFAFNYLSGGIAAVLLGDASVVDTSAATGFIGIVSDTPQSLFIAANAVFPGDAGNDRYFLNDFRINAPVPEPSTWMMLAAGGWLLSRRLRRRERD